MVDAALISAADDGDLEAVERYFTQLDVLENVAVCNAIHRRHRHGEPSPTDDMDDDFDPWYWSGRGDLFVAYIVPRGQVDVFRWFFAREQRELCEETLRGLAKGIVRSCIEIGGFLTVCEMIEIVFESPLFDETMDEDERHGLLRVMMRYVVKFGCVKWVDMLLAYGADPSCAWELEPPLTEIGDQQSAKTLEALHAHGAWMEGCRLSMVRTDYAATDLVADLLRSGADANAEQPTNSQYFTKLWDSAATIPRNC